MSRYTLWWKTYTLLMRMKYRAPQKETFVEDSLMNSTNLCRKIMNCRAVFRYTVSNDTWLRRGANSLAVIGYEMVPAKFTVIKVRSIPAFLHLVAMAEIRNSSTQKPTHVFILMFTGEIVCCLWITSMDIRNIREIISPREVNSLEGIRRYEVRGRSLVGTG